MLVFFTSLGTSVNPANLDQSNTHDNRLFHAWSCHALYPMIILKPEKLQIICNPENLLPAQLSSVV